MKKENNNKEPQNYSGNSIASHWLSGTWLGNLLGYGNNTYTDGYGTTRQNPTLGESAQGQQLSRMKDTAKNYATIALTGASFGNPLAARTTLGAIVPTAAQSYFMTGGLQDAYNRFMKKDKTAEDAVLTGLDLAGAVPAVGSVIKNGKYFLPEVKNILDKQARITARQYRDYQPTTQLSPAGEPSKPFTYLWDLDQSDAIDLKDVGKYEDAITDGFKDAQNIFLNKGIFESLYNKPRTGITSHNIDKTPKEEFLNFGVWPENVRITSLPKYTLGTTLSYRTKDNMRPFVPNWFREKSSEARSGGNIKIDVLQSSSPLELRKTAMHEAIHSKGFGYGIDPENIHRTLLGSDYKMIIENTPLMKYLYKYPEIAAHVLSNWQGLNPVKLAQPFPKSQKEWSRFTDDIQAIYNTRGASYDAGDFHEFLGPILHERNLLKRLKREEDVKNLDKQLFEILNGTAF